MKLILALLVMPMVLFSDVVVSDEFLNALAIVESNNDSSKVGKLGELGILQIRKCVLDDVNRVFKTNYTINDTKDDEKSREICRKYLKHWGGIYERRTGLKADHQVLAKIWNGGPLAPTKKRYAVARKLSRYWMKVRQYIETA